MSMNREYLILLLLFYIGCMNYSSQKTYVRTRNTDFFIGNSKYPYIGCNYWYGGYLYTDTVHNGRQRLIEELDFLSQKGITNLRVFFCGEGDSSYPYRIYPSVQPVQGTYKEDILKGFDFLLDEAAKRNMKLVCVLNNNWEWSGGFGQYLEWSGVKNPPLPKTKRWDWDAYCLYISKFYSSDSCIKYSNQWIGTIINRINTINGIAYKEDPCIMAWQLANEPRPMDSSAVEAYIQWVKRTSRFIKSMDKNHLISVGVEGIIGTRYSDSIFKVIHACSDIDYCTIHLWPKTWQWYNGEHAQAVADSTLLKTSNYIIHHSQLCKKLNKPLVIEEFGLHRDNNLFTHTASTKARDKYYDHVFKIGKAHQIAGYNFWGYSGLKENVNSQKYMQKGMAYSADPPQEEQGLYAVFPSDSTTWMLIQSHLNSLLH